MPFRRILTVAILGSIFGLPAGLAQEPGWVIRANGYYVDPGDRPTVSLTGGIVLSTDNSSGAGLGIGVEYRFTQRLGVELAVLAADHGDFFLVIDPPGRRLKVGDTLSFEFVGGGVDFHLIPASKVDLYLGPTLGIVSYSNMSVEFSPSVLPPVVIPPNVRIEIESDLAYGVNLGLDVPLGDRGWIFNANLRYLLTTADASVAGLGSQKIDYDPLLGGIGFGYRF